MLQEYRIPIPLGNIAFTGKEAMYHARNIARATDYKSKFVVKAQVQTSNRSRGYFLENDFMGGIHICETPEEVRDVAEQMCGKTLVTPSVINDTYYGTGTQGFLCRCVYVMEVVEQQHSYFIQISLDRNTNSPVIKYSTVGGMSYQKIMSEYPDKMKSIHVDFLTNLRMDSLLNVAVDLGIEN